MESALLLKQEKVTSMKNTKSGLYCTKTFEVSCKLENLKSDSQRN